MEKTQSTDQNSESPTLAQATEIIVINAGGFLYMTCKSTLLSSGARFFKDILKQSDTAQDMKNVCDSKKRNSFYDHSKSGKIISSEDTSPPNNTLFLDCDPFVFSDVLHFMRRNCISPETRTDAIRLEKLRIEAEFFSYDALAIACNKRLEAIKNEDLLQNEYRAKSGFVTTSEGDDKVIHVPDGQVLFIVSAALAGECRARRYASYDDNNIPGCYINTCEKDHSGDFQLHYYHTNDEGRNYSQDLRCCIAHVGLDQIHCGRVPLDVNFREDLRLCISPQPGHNWIALGSTGAGTWHVHYWIGHPNEIPELKKSSYQDRTAKKRKLQHLPNLAASKKNKKHSSVFTSKTSRLC